MCNSCTIYIALLVILVIIIVIIKIIITKIIIINISSVAFIYFHWDLKRVKLKQEFIKHKNGKYHTILY